MRAPARGMRTGVACTVMLTLPRQQFMNLLVFCARSLAQARPRPGRQELLGPFSRSLACVVWARRRRRATASASEASAWLGAAGAAKPKAGGGLLGAFVRSLGVSVVGTAALTRGDIEGALAQLKRKLMERNVAEEIAEKRAPLLLWECIALGFKGIWLQGRLRLCPRTPESALDNMGYFSLKTACSTVSLRVPDIRMANIANIKLGLNKSCSLVLRWLQKFTCSSAQAERECM